MTDAAEPITEAERGERLADLLEAGRGLPRAVSLGGPGAVDAWCEQQELDIAAEEADADVLAMMTADAEELPADEDGGDDILGRLAALEEAVAALHGTVDALAVQAPPEDVVARVAAGGDPNPKPKKKRPRSRKSKSKK